MKTRCIAIAATLASIALCAACADYEFTVNEKVVYTPLPLFSDYALADEALHQCITQSIEDGRVTRAEDLLAINCSHAGIQKLDGIETFAGLQSIQLQDNDVADLRPLGKLTQLQQLNLAGNNLHSAAGLEWQGALYRLDLRNNPELDCSSIVALAQRKALQLSLPRHCR